MKERALSLMLLAFAAVPLRAEIKTETVLYKHGKTVLEGYIAYDDGVQDKRPGVLVVHEWMGLGKNVRDRAEKLAAMGYVAFAADMYGKGVRPQTVPDAMKESSKYKSDRKLMRERIGAALEQIKKNRYVDETKIAAIGYCFGGTTVLELARSGADVKGVASFHGNLDTPNMNDAKNIKGKVLVLHGADDPYVPQDQVNAFQGEMRKAGVDWQMVYYSGAVHSFTNPEAGSDNSKGAAYNSKADLRSWDALMLFFGEILQ